MNTHTPSPISEGNHSENPATFSRTGITNAEQTLTAYPGPIHAHWQAQAEEAGFTITGRMLDRYHIALRCHACGQVHASRIYTLMSARPQCPACMIARLDAEADAAGLVHLQRDPENRHYSVYRAACGHHLRRQHEIIRRVTQGATELRCETCHAATEEEEARARGWRLVGSDPEGDPSYRLYAHAEGCGHHQRIARANLQTGRFACGGCSAGWAAERSWLYVMAFTRATGRELIKLGYSRDPDARLRHQLRIDPEMSCEILRVVGMPSGQAAIRIEKAMHARLRRTYPEEVVDPGLYRGQIRVRSEIYEASLTPQIMVLLDDVERVPAAPDDRPA